MKPMIRTALIYGTIATAIITLFFWLTHTFWIEENDFSMGEILGYVSMILAFTMIYFGVRSYRNLQPEQKISFGKAFLVGLAITIVASVWYVIGWMIYYQQNPEIMNSFFEQSIEQVKQGDLSTAEMQAKITEMEEFQASYQKPLVRIGFTLMEILPMGLVISLASALILKRK